MKQESTWSYMVYIDQALAPQKGISMREREREHWLKATGNVSIPGANSFLSFFRRTKVGAMDGATGQASCQTVLYIL